MKHHIDIPNLSVILGKLGRKPFSLFVKSLDNSAYLKHSQKLEHNGPFIIISPDKSWTDSQQIKYKVRRQVLDRQYFLIFIFPLFVPTTVYERALTHIFFKVSVEILPVPLNIL